MARTHIRNDGGEGVDFATVPRAAIYLSACLSAALKRRVFRVDVLDIGEP